MPNTNFLENYLAYMDGTEAPYIYNVWAALSTVGSAVSRRVYIKYGRFRVYLNMYLVFVGPSGGRKTTAMEVSQKMLERLGTIPMSGTSETKEAICYRMARECVKSFNLPDGSLEEYTPFTLCLTELSHFLGGNSHHMIDFLTTIYNHQGQYTAHTKNKGTDAIPNPYLNMIACTTPTHIATYLKDHSITGGAARRILFIYEDDDGKPVAWPEELSTQTAAYEQCISWLYDLQDVAGEFEWTPEARAWWTPWYEEHFAESKLLQEDVIRGYSKSKHEQLIKTACLLALTESKKLVMEVRYLEAALKLLNLAESRFAQVYAALGRNELSPIAAKMVTFVETCGGSCSEKDLEGAFYKYVNGKEYSDMIAFLLRTDKLKRIGQKNAEGVITRQMLFTPRKWEAIQAESKPPPLS